MTESRKVRVPGRFESYFSGTSVGQGEWQEYDGGGNEGARLLSEAYDGARRVRVGRGSRLEMQLTAAAAEVLKEYALMCIDCNLYGDMDRGEMRAAQAVIDELDSVFSDEEKVRDLR